MHLFDAAPAIVADLKDESLILSEKRHASNGMTVVVARHPTLGKLVIAIGSDGSGIVVQADE